MNYTVKRRLSVRAFKVWHIVTDYTKNSSVHGIRYLTEQNRPIIEKIWWIIVFIAAIVTCSSMIFYKIVYRNSFPIMFSVSENPIAIWEIPFPAITICPPFRYNPQKFNFKIRLNLHALGVPKNRSWVSQKDLRKISQLETLFHFIDPIFSKKFNDSSNLTSGFDQFINLYQVTPSGRDLLTNCQFQTDRDVFCPNYITEIITDDGICLTFNLLNLTEIFKKNTQPYMDYEKLNSEGFKGRKPFTKNKSNQSSCGWKLNNGYESDTSNILYPLRITANTHEDFKIVMQIPKQYKIFDYENFDQTFSNGTDKYKEYYENRYFRMILHSPADIPQIRKKYLALQSKNKYNIMVKPIVVNTTEDLYNYDAEVRQCYFSHEGDLEFFEIYTQDNCELECLAKYTFHECNCVTLPMPRKPDTKICSYREILCYQKAEKNFEQSIFYGNKSSLNCNCLKACTDIQYEVNVVDKTSIEYSDGISLSISYIKNDLIIYQRKERQSLVDFLSFAGGILSLFMGVSLISFIEIIYYFSIRFMCNIGMRWQHQRRINRNNV